MKRKPIFRGATILLSLLMLLQAAAFASAADPSTGGTVLPIVSEPITLTVYHKPPNTLTVNNLGDLEAVRELEKRTGIHLEFIHPSRSDTGEMLSTILASGSKDYPDLIRNNLDKYAGGVEGAIKDGIIVDSTELVNQYAVNYKKLVEQMGAEKLVVSDNGVQIAFGCVFAPQEFLGTSFAGLAIRKDWLEELNLEIPQSIDDWYTTLKAFKEQKGCDAPLALASATFAGSRTQAFVGSFGAAYTFLLKEGQVKYGPILPEFKSFLETFSKWYAEGLINEDLATADQNKNILPMAAQGQAGAVEIHPIAFANIYAMVDRTKDPDLQFWPCPYPQVTQGQVCQYRHDYAAYNPGLPFLITTKNAYPVESVKLIDYLYSDEGHFLCAWGAEEGRSYVANPDGSHAFTELITNNPEGLSAEQAKYKYTLGDLIGQYDGALERMQYALPEQVESAWGIWKTSATSENYIPDLITMTKEEAGVYSNVMSQVNAYANGMILKFIMGLEPLSKFDAFVDTVKSMGIEEAEEARNAAYARFINR